MCSLHRTEKGAMVCRMASGGHLSLAGDRWLTRISLLGNGRPPSPPCFIGNTSISPRYTSPWNIRMLTPAGAPAAGATPPLPPTPPPSAPGGGGRGAAIASGESEWEKRGRGSVISRSGSRCLPPPASPASAETRSRGFWCVGNEGAEKGACGRGARLRLYRTLGPGGGVEMVPIVRSGHRSGCGRADQPTKSSPEPGLRPGPARQ